MIHTKYSAPHCIRRIGNKRHITNGRYVSLSLSLPYTLSPSISSYDIDLPPLITSTHCTGASSFVSIYEICLSGKRQRRFDGGTKWDRDFLWYTYVCIVQYIEFLFPQEKFVQKARSVSQMFAISYSIFHFVPSLRLEKSLCSVSYDSRCLLRSVSIARTYIQIELLSSGYDGTVGYAVDSVNLNLYLYY